MTIADFLRLPWEPAPSVLAGCFSLLAGYALLQRFRFTHRASLFATGVGLLLFVLISPLDTLSDTYLFSAHMIQHILLVLVVPPFLIMGLPTSLVQNALQHGAIRKSEVWLSQPFLAWILQVGSLWLWHLPPLYNAALANDQVHILQHLNFLVAATIFWWPVFAPLEELRLQPLQAVLYLFLAALSEAILGIILTFTPPGVYPAYLHPLDSLGILKKLRHGMGLIPAVDQQVGGLIMWVPGGLIYLGAMMASLARWYRSPEVDSLPSGIREITETN